MVLVGEKKYACETCIKGHRSSTCKHTDRPLYEIKKKGRPVTQCEHCRQLRKTKQVHVKCMCGAKEQQQPESDEPTASITFPVAIPTSVFKKKGGKKVPVSAAFPSGLPETLGASVALSEGSDSEPGSDPFCMCDSTGTCNCTTPRTSSSTKLKRKPKSRKNSRVEHDSDSDSQPRMNQPAALVASAHIAGKRPVLPRPSGPSSDRPSPPRSSHSPSGAPQHSRMHPSAFSPYERAYDYARGAEVGEELPASLYASVPSHPPVLPNPSPNAQYQQGQESEDMQAFMAAWYASLQQPGNTEGSMDFPVTCDCGPNCACPGCIIHQNVPNPPHGAPSCVNPQTCLSCMDCTMLNVTQDNTAIEEWFRRIPNSSGGFSPPQSPRLPQSTSAMPSSSILTQKVSSYDPSIWPTYALWPNLQNQIASAPPPEDATSTCCGGQCQCPIGGCMCPIDCCGCCAGCTCTECAHEDPSLGSGKTLTFAVSGERGACCSHGSRPASHTDPPVPILYGQQSQPGPSNLNVGRPMPNLDAQFDFQGQLLDLRGTYEEWSASTSSPMDVPRVSLSRASSTSSHSSVSRHSHSSHGSHHRESVSPSPNIIAPAAVRSCCATLASTQMEPPSRATSASDPSSTADSPIPTPFTPAVDPNQDHRTFTGSLF